MIKYRHSCNCCVQVAILSPALLSVWPPNLLHAISPFRSKAERTPSPHDMNRQECRTKRIDSVCALIWIPLCARDGSVIKWGRGEGRPCLFMSCAFGLTGLRSIIQYSSLPCGVVAFT